MGDDFSYDVISHNYVGTIGEKKTHKLYRIEFTTRNGDKFSAERYSYAVGECIKYFTEMLDILTLNLVEIGEGNH